MGLTLIHNVHALESAGHCATKERFPEAAGELGTLRYCTNPRNFRRDLVVFGGFGLF
jgi:hypothetical protein